MTGVYRHVLKPRRVRGFVGASAFAGVAVSGLLMRRAPPQAPRRFHPRPYVRFATTMAPAAVGVPLRMPRRSGRRLDDRKFLQPRLAVLGAAAVVVPAIPGRQSQRMPTRRREPQTMPQRSAVLGARHHVPLVPEPPRRTFVLQPRAHPLPPHIALSRESDKQHVVKPNRMSVMHFERYARSHPRRIPTIISVGVPTVAVPLLRRPRLSYELFERLKRESQFAAAWHRKVLGRGIVPVLGVIPGETVTFARERTTRQLALESSALVLAREFTVESVGPPFE